MNKISIGAAKNMLVSYDHFENLTRIKSTELTFEKGIMYTLKLPSGLSFKGKLINRFGNLGQCLSGFDERNIRCHLSLNVAAKSELISSEKIEPNLNETIRKIFEKGDLLKAQTMILNNTSISTGGVETIEFNDIKDNLDFFELVDKFKDTHKLRGGQKSDGTWYLTGLEE